jgi:hypothetical protein
LPSHSAGNAAAVGQADTEFNIFKTDWHLWPFDFSNAEFDTRGQS